MAVHMLRLHCLLALQSNILSLQRNSIANPQHGLEDRRNPLEIYGDGPFKQRYRLSKQTIVHLCDVLRQDLAHPTS